MVRFTGERPTEGSTPDSLLALHAAGYREVRARLGPGRVLDTGCGLGEGTSSLAGSGRTVVGADYDPTTALAAHRRHRFPAACMDAAGLGIRTGGVDWVCSSHLVEHFAAPETHIAELARVVEPGGAAFVVTPNAPADFENPFHLVLFRRHELETALRAHFDDVRVWGLAGSDAVKEDFARRRRTGRRLVALDVLDLRHKVPRRWYIAAYSLVLRIVYRLLGNRYSGGATGITVDDFFLTDDVDDATPVLFAVARQPRRSASSS